MEAKMLLLLLLATLGPAAGSHHGRPMPGSPYDISRNAAAVQQAVLGATHSFNSQSNDAFLFKPSAVVRAQRQVVRGIRYIVDFQISRTVCPKRNRTSDLDRCHLQPPGRLAQVSLDLSRRRIRWFWILEVLTDPSLSRPSGVTWSCG
ncbi:cystatin isoform X1 [Xiphophorus couchianus]|uniref:cystatin isoform X1 n=1 Tax=Xiphophorus couchianus TaxID=32473 RepID=UPI0010166A58|nr:cystatin-F isoform X1 [Xiphophorus couchianus]